MVIVRCVRSDNESFIIGQGAWRIISKGLTGIDYPSVSVYSEKNGIGDGALSTGKRIDDREIKIVARTTNPANNALVRKATIAFFNPKYSYKLYITYQGVTRWIGAEIESFSCPSQNVHRNMELTLKFYCADPYLKSTDDFGQNIASTTPLLAFPYIECMDPVIHTVSDYFNFNQQAEVHNDGDVQTYARAVIEFAGNVTNPRVYKNEYYVRVLGTFVEGDRVEIDFEDCTITKNGTNIIQYVDRTSAFTNMDLNIGDSLMGFDADDGDAYMDVYLYYNKRYLGI